MIIVEVAVARGRVPQCTSAARGRESRPISQTTAATGPGVLRPMSIVLRAFSVPTMGRRSVMSPTRSPSSSGLGLRPFKAATRVRIPLGALPENADF